MTFRTDIASCVALILAIPGLCAPVLAQDQRMITQAEAPLWNAVGRLNVAGNRFCTATLISPDEAITAAHCLFHPVTHHRAEPQDIRFVAGFRRNTYAALVGISAVAISPLFAYQGLYADLPSIPYDLALLKLDRALLPSEVTPLAIAEWPAGQISVDIIGYGRDRPQIASIRVGCPYLSDDAGVKLMDCAVVPGLSGAPAVVSGSQSLVALVSTSIGPRVKGTQSLLVPIAPRLAALRALLDD